MNDKTSCFKWEANLYHLGALILHSTIMQNNDHVIVGSSCILELPS